MYCNFDEAVHSAEETNRLLRNIVGTTQDLWQDAQAKKFTSLYLEELDQQLKANVRLIKDIQEQVNHHIRGL